jgi:hypothetical protein
MECSFFEITRLFFYFFLSVLRKVHVWNAGRLNVTLTSHFSYITGSRCCSLSVLDHSHCCETSQHFNCNVPMWVTHMFKVFGHKHGLCIQASRTKRNSRQTMEFDCKVAVRIKMRGEVHITRVGTLIVATIYL